MTEQVIRVENIRGRNAAASEAVLAEFDIRLGGVLIRDCRLIAARNGGRFVGMPRRRHPGTDEWYDVIELSDALRRRVQDAAEAAVAEGMP